MNTRRQFLIALGAGTFAAPLFSFAQQQGKIWRVGFLSPRGRPGSLESDVQVGALLRAMRELGYVEGKNLTIEWRFADGKYERLQGYANELAQLKVDVIVATDTTATHAAQKSTSTIPIVMGSSPDPVGSGVVKSLARPGGNITGLASITADISGKHLEMLLGMVPRLYRVAVLVNPGNSGNPLILTSVQTASRSTNARILPVEARTAPEIEQAFAAMKRENAGAVIVAADSLFTQQARQIAELAATHRLPSISANREFAEAGCLMSYGASRVDMFRRVATYVDKILKGAKPAELPVEQPTKFELIINGKSAKALGLKIPQSLLIMADKVIE